MRLNAYANGSCGNRDLLKLQSPDSQAMVA